MEAKRSEDTSVLEGQLEGVKVTDLTEIGKKYRDILAMGDKPGEKRDGDKIERRSSEDEIPQFLRFSVHISPQSVVSSVSQSNDVHLSVSVPSIHYTHSVNLVREVEMFVSDFQQLSRAVMESFSSAAVGVAKGIVNEKSQFAEQLSTSLGPRAIHSSMFHSVGVPPEIDTTDAPLDSTPRDHLYLDILVQSPVITLPSSLHGDKCLVAYLGEISVKNSFSSGGITDSLSKSIAGNLTPEREILTVKIDRMSLHATQDVRSRELLVASGGRSSQGKWWKVLDETSVVVKIDRKVGRGVGEGEKIDSAGAGGSTENIVNGEGTDFDIKSEPWTMGETSNDREDRDRGGERERQTPSVWVSEADPSIPADVVVTGEICDHLLISLPKEVFDQIRVTLKHGLYKPISRKRKTQTEEGEASLSNYQAKRSNSVTSSQSSQGIPKSEQSLKVPSDLSQTVAVSFSLPRLSLQLKHTIGSKEKDLVFISFEEFTANCHKSEPHTTSVEIALKSIIIEDLIQDKESEYRYILASSTKPFTGISPLRSAASSFGLQRLSISPSHLSHPLLPFSHLMSSTPRVAPSLDSASPLKSFTPHNDRSKTGKASLRPDPTGSVREQSTRLSRSETSFATPKTSLRHPSRISSSSQEVKISISEPSFPDDSDECEVTGSTLRPEGSSHGSSLHGNTNGDVMGLLSIKAVFIDKEHPHFAKRFNSVS